MKATSNRQAFIDGKKILDNLTRERFLLALYQLGYMLIRDAEFQAEYRNLTGNTVTSLAFGLYVDGALSDVVTLDKEAPLRTKLTKGDVLTNFVDYDGRLRKRFYAEADTDGGYGYDTSLTFLKGYRIPKKWKYAIVVTTGTEYSEYLQNVLNLNVLQDTEIKAETSGYKMFINSFKPID